MEKGMYSFVLLIILSFWDISSLVSDKSSKIYKLEILCVLEIKVTRKRIVFIQAVRWHILKIKVITEALGNTGLVSCGFLPHGEKVAL